MTPSPETRSVFLLDMTPAPEPPLILDPRPRISKPPLLPP